MPTKAQLTKAEEFQTRRAATVAANGSIPPRRTPVPAKPHNLGERAGRHAAVVYEASETKPSRKSTRKSKHHLRAAAQLEHSQVVAHTTPKAHASVASVRTMAVGGKPRR
jgi:hypothetical protein